MTNVYGNTIGANSSYSPSCGWRCKLIYTTSTSNTSVTINVGGVGMVDGTDDGFGFTAISQSTGSSVLSGYINVNGVRKWTSDATYPMRSDPGENVASVSITRTKTAQSIPIVFSFYNNKYGAYSGSTAIILKGTSTASTNVTVPAKPSYSVSYNANNGSGAPSAQTKWYDEALTLSTTKPTRQYHKFDGWATSASGAAAYCTGTNNTSNTSYTANAAVTLYAHWTRVHQPPTISSFTVVRCDANGDPDDEGAYCKANVTWSVDTAVYSSNVGSTLSIAVSGVEGTESVNLSGTGTTTEVVYDAAELDVDLTYVVTATVTDGQSTSTSRNAILSMAFFTMDFKEGGHGVGIGKPSTVDNLLDIGMPTKFANKIYWKEDGYGDKFAIVPSFNGADDANLLKIQSAVGGAGTDPELSDKFAIAGSTGNAFFYGRLVNLQHGVANTDSMFVAKRTDTGTSVGFGIGSGGVNHGVYSHKLNNWIIYADAANVWVNKTINRNIGSSGVSYIDGGKGNAALYLKKNTGSYWYPAITLDTASGGSWQIGNYNTEQLELVYTTKAYRDASNNSMPGHIYLSAPPAARNWYVARILYDNNTGTNGTVTLAETAANFAFMFIGYRNENSFYSGIFVRSPNGKSVALGNSVGDTSAVGMRVAWCKISGTSLTRSSNGLIWVSSNGTCGISNGNTHIYVTHVIGFA